MPHYATTLLGCLLAFVAVLIMQPEPAWIPVPDGTIETLLGILAVAGIVVSIGHLKEALKKEDQ